MPSDFKPITTNISAQRRLNLLTLLREFIEKELEAGRSANGAETLFSASLEISKSMLSQIKSSRVIGDKLARQIETKAGKSDRWLDGSHTEQQQSPAEVAFVELARKAWQAQNAKGKRELMRFIRHQVE